MSDASDDPAPFTLISVLFSTLTLTPSLARLLLETAYRLYAHDESVGEISGALVQGRVENLRKPMLLGVLGGPAFEATLDTERGSGRVRFLLTEQGLGFMAEREAPRSLN